jgi:signal transduction histidine kinase
MVSHELRTPLTSIIGFSELLSEEHVGEISEEQDQYIRMILQKSKDLLHLINDLLDSGKLESGRMAIRIREVHLANVISSVISSTRHVTDNQPVIQPDIPEDLPSFEADQDKLTQVLTNLVANALKFSPPGSPVQIKARTISGRRDGDTGELLHISVEDHGAGIHEEHHERIFDRFFQVDQGPSRTHRGAGLGLYITRSFVELHGGKVWVDSVVGEGSTFHLTIPVRQE